MERKLVVVKTVGIIPELGGISGPIVAPTRIPINTICKMVSKGRIVYECCPSDPRNADLQVELTLENYRSDNFGVKEDKTAEKKSVEKQTVSQKPVQPVVNDEKKEDTAEPVDLDPTQFTPELDIPEVEE